ncbi:hypothetical protein GEV33_006255 [Tenebrio molitor]|uniref:Uncharacterized protein n=1 Tax=Tenebrio molitor TaxID=7067 RepID=A0A8J6HCZ8_TENMO|nr:hypothetical protein GEV33_006255 [Tenebrio molitor]
MSLNDELSVADSYRNFEFVRVRTKKDDVPVGSRDLQHRSPASRSSEFAPLRNREVRRFGSPNKEGNRVEGNRCGSVPAFPLAVGLLSTESFTFSSSTHTFVFSSGRTVMPRPRPFGIGLDGLGTCSRTPLFLFGGKSEAVLSGCRRGPLPGPRYSGGNGPLWETGNRYRASSVAEEPYCLRRRQHQSNTTWHGTTALPGVQATPVKQSPDRLKGTTCDLFELLEKAQSSRLDDQRCVLPAYFNQSASFSETFQISRFPSTEEPLILVQHDALLFCSDRVYRPPRAVTKQDTEDIYSRILYHIFRNLCVFVCCAISVFLF